MERPRGWAGPVSGMAGDHHKIVGAVVPCTVVRTGAGLQVLDQGPAGRSGAAWPGARRTRDVGRDADVATTGADPDSPPGATSAVGSSASAATSGDGGRGIHVELALDLEEQSSASLAALASGDACRASASSAPATGRRRQELGEEGGREGTGVPTTSTGASALAGAPSPGGARGR